MDSRQTTPSPSWLAVKQEIEELLARVDPQAFQSLLQAFADKDRRWFFSGQGRSGLVAQMAAMRFMHLGYEVHVVGEATAPAVCAGDGLVLICGSGQTPISVGFAGVAKSAGAHLVLLTHKPQSKLAAMADLLLPIPMMNTAQFGGSLFEQCGLILLDSVALELTRHVPDAHSEMGRRHTNMQ
jgi:6-phospho-3-hexuloisomerase